MKKLLVFGSLVVGMCAGIALFPEFSHAATLSLSPASGSYQAGQTFTVTVNLDTTGAAIDGVDLYYLNYNPSILQVVDANTSTAGVQITPGTLMSGTLSNSVSSGRVHFSQVTSGGQ